MNVGWIENGDYIKVKGVAFGTGATSFTARVASATSGGRIEVRLDSATGPLVGTCTVAGTGGWQTLDDRRPARSPAPPARTTCTCGSPAAAATCSTSTGGSSAAGAAATPTAYRITNRNSGQVIDVQQPNLDDLAVIGQWTSNGTAWQQWRFLDAGNGNVRLQSVHSGKCVDVSGASHRRRRRGHPVHLPRRRQPGRSPGARPVTATPSWSTSTAASASPWSTARPRRVPRWSSGPAAAATSMQWSRS